MCFSAKTSLSISLQTDGEAIAEVNKSKFLCVIIGNKLSWKDHISFVCRKVTRGIRVIIKARKVLHSEALKCLYYSLFSYQVWGSACKTNIEHLLSLQKRIIGIILDVHPRSPSEPLLITLKFLSLENIFKYLIGRLIYKIYHRQFSALHCFCLQKIAVYTYTIPVRNAIIMCHCVELTWRNLVWDIMALLYGTTFLISIQTPVDLFSLEILQQQYVITCFDRSRVLHVLLIYNCWQCHYVILCHFDIFCFCCSFGNPVEIYLPHVKQTMSL